MRSHLKQGYSVAKRNVLPPLASTTRVLYGMGITEFNVETAWNFYNLPNKKNDPNPDDSNTDWETLLITLIWIFIISQVISLLCSRIPALYRFYQNDSSADQKALEDSNPVIRVDDQNTAEDDAPQKPISPLRLALQKIRRKTIIGSAKFFATTTAGMGTLTAYLGIVRLLDFVSQAIFQVNLKQQGYKDIVYLTTGSVAAILASLSTYTYNLPPSIRNAEKICDYLDGLTPPPKIDKQLSLSVLFTCLNVISVGPLYYNTSYHALGELPYLPPLGDSIKIPIACFAGFSNFATSVITSPFATYDSLKEKKPTAASESVVISGERIIHGGVYTFAGISSLENGFMNKISVCKFADTFFEWNPKGLVMILAIPCGISTTISLFNYFGQRGYTEFIRPSLEKWARSTAQKAESTLSETQPLLSERQFSVEEGEGGKKNTCGCFSIGLFTSKKTPPHTTSEVNDSSILPSSKSPFNSPAPRR
jgi:hypothetical protein